MLFSSSSEGAPCRAVATVPTSTPSIGFDPLSWPLEILDRAAFHRTADRLLGTKAATTRYPFRALRYWWAAAALAEHQRRLNAPLHILDAGCQGGFLKRVADASFRARWAGLDCRLDHPHLPAAGYDILHQADLERPLPFEPGCFDAIVSLHVFEHLRAPEATLREYARILRPDGLVLLGFPTMPALLARIREAQHRRGIAQGRRPDWGHQQVFDPGRCRALAAQSGLTIELITGSHFFRKTGCFLENFPGWVRFNQRWGRRFPALGSELCVILRKPGTAP